MKVVLFCGGMGTRLREFTDDIPKPLVQIGYRPIIWHLMKYYAYYGHKDFILCLGYKADKIKNYFLNYNEFLSNDFTLSDGGATLELRSKDITEWRITFVDTGLKSNIGQRLKAVENYLDGEEYFLANYSDGLTTMPLPDMEAQFRASGKVASFMCVKPSQSFHVVEMGNDNLVSNITAVRDTKILINGGFFIFKKDIFSYMYPGEELVEKPFQRLIDADELLGYRYDKFWVMDTFKEHQELTDIVNSGVAPWEIWKTNQEK